MIPAEKVPTTLKYCEAKYATLARLASVLLLTGIDAYYSKNYNSKFVVHQIIENGKLIIQNDSNAIPDLLITIFSPSQNCNHQISFNNNATL